MKTKTLLIAAAALAAGVISSQAQSVYSQNIVGYVNQTSPGGFALTLVANPLQNITGSTTNNGTSVFQNFVGGESVLVWNGNGYYQYIYAGAGVGTGLGYASDFYDGNPGTAAAIPGTVYDASDDAHWTPPLILSQGKGVYVSNPGATITNTYVGNAIIQNTNTPVSLVGGFGLSLVGSTVPLGGNITNQTLPFIGGESVLVWNGNGYYQYIYAGAGVGTGLGYASDYYDGNPGTAAAIPGTVYDASDDAYWTPALNIKVGQGYFVSNPGSTLQWKQNLVVP